MHRSKAIHVRPRPIQHANSNGLDSCCFLKASQYSVMNVWWELVFWVCFSISSCCKAVKFPVNGVALSSPACYLIEAFSLKHFTPNQHLLPKSNHFYSPNPAILTVKIFSKFRKICNLFWAKWAGQSCDSAESIRIINWGSASWNWHKQDGRRLTCSLCCTGVRSPRHMIGRTTRGSHWVRFHRSMGSDAHPAWDKNMSWSRWGWWGRSLHRWTGWQMRNAWLWITGRWREGVWPMDRRGDGRQIIFGYVWHRF